MAAPRWLTGVNVLLAAGFAASAALQYNDPDPLRWMALYGAAAVACVLHGRVSWAYLVSAAVALVALVWGVSIALGIERAVPVAHLFHPMEMKGGPVEETREAIGLGLVAIWMLVLLWLEWRARARRGRTTR